MMRVRAGEPREAARGYVRRTAVIESASGIGDIWFMTPADTEPLADDWLFAVGLVAGMSCGEDVHVCGRVSERLVASIGPIQQVIQLRHPNIAPVRVTVEGTAPTPRGPGEQTLSCFSGGVDAFYTAHEAHEQIDELLYVHGLEAFAHHERVLSYILPHVRSAAAELGRPLRLAETNWRTVIHPITGHDYYVSMPMVFAIAHLMGSRFTRLLVPGTWDHLVPIEHPSSVASFVGLWQTEGLETVEHGHVTRLDKIRRLAKSDVAMRHLRVCWNDRNPVYNCGKCTKCFRTRIHLKLVGAEGRCGTLPPLLPLEVIRRAKAESPQHTNYMDENIAAAEAQGMTELAAALRAQRGNRPRPPAPWQVRLATPGRWLRNQVRSAWRRSGDLHLHHMKWRSGEDHLFNCIASSSRERRP